MAVPKDVILISAVDTYIAANPQGPQVDRQKLKEGIVNQTRITIDAQNALLAKTTRLKVPENLTNVQIARIIELLEPVVLISCDNQSSENEDFDLLGVYMYNGKNEGIYDTRDIAMKQLVTCYNFEATEYDIRQVKHYLQIRLRLDRKYRCMDRDLIAVNNGIFNYKTKQLEPFSPDRIFLSKSRVNYNPNAKNITIHNPDDNTDWDVESWMQELSNDPGIVNLLWQVLGAIIRPFVRWDKSAWFYSTSGNSGKGTLCELMRNLCGRGSYASIALSDFSKEFMLELLIHSSAIIVDENDVGIYLDKVANLKAVTTNDVLLINRKFKKPIAYQFFGLMVQCLNEYPRIRDTSDSFYRRQLFIPFDKCFTGHARKYIKDDYLSRPEVLEYVLFKVLNMNYYEFDEPASCKAVLADYKGYNNPVQSFLEEMLPETVWGLLPFGFLYDLYKAWFAENSPSGKIQGKNTFIKEVADMAEAGKIPGFTCPGRKVAMRPKQLMDAPEPLILQYDLKKWMNPTYKGTDRSQICMTGVKATYKGLVRIGHEADSRLPVAAVQASANDLQVMDDIRREIDNETKNI